MTPTFNWYAMPQKHGYASTHVKDAADEARPDNDEPASSWPKPTDVMRSGRCVACRLGD